MVSPCDIHTCVRAGRPRISASEASPTVSIACCGVFHDVFVGCHDDLGILEKLGDIVCLLVANHLLHGLLHGNIGCLALDHRERNAVDKQNNVRTGIVKLILAFYSEFFRHMEQVVLRMLPVDVFQIEAEGLSAAHSFRVAFAQQQSVIDLFAGVQKKVPLNLNIPQYL